jgi:hypothetical protein
MSKNYFSKKLASFTLAGFYAVSSEFASGNIYCPDPALVKITECLKANASANENNLRNLRENILISKSDGRILKSKEYSAELSYNGSKIKVSYSDSGPNNAADGMIGPEDEMEFLSLAPGDERLILDSGVNGSLRDEKYMVVTYDKRFWGRKEKANLEKEYRDIREQIAKNLQIIYRK